MEFIIKQGHWWILLQLCLHQNWLELIEKSVHFKKTVAQISFLSKLWYFQYKSKPQFWKKPDSRNCLLLRTDFKWIQFQTAKSKFSPIPSTNFHTLDIFTTCVHPIFIIFLHFLMCILQNPLKCFLMYTFSLCLSQEICDLLVPLNTD